MNSPFNSHHLRYEGWFGRHEAAYLSELLAVRAMLPREGIGLEIGVGTGRFAAPLGINFGIDPSSAMLSYSIKRGITCLQGIAEAQPFKDAVFDYALLVTTICFVDDPKGILKEAHRILKPGAPIIIGFIDRTSELGQYYFDHQAENIFYRSAMFYSALEVEKLLSDTGFAEQTWGQTLSKPLNDVQEIQPFSAGRGQEAFVVARAIRA
ncbi:MAG: class I SAM-dependent methyltransferase [Deltaproteobacteria bacterium]|nr:class I SAM-dependent methyltransferase [Deltaproteobacteria bacterium]